LKVDVDDRQTGLAAPDPWRQLRALTPARIALGRSGASLPTAAHLEFQLAHARARDAVHDVLDVGALGEALRHAGFSWRAVRSAAGQRARYLQRPDLGRRLDPPSRELLQRSSDAERTADAVFVVADGLSAGAAQRHAVPVLAQVAPRLLAQGWHLAPVIVAEQGRVALGDEIGGLLSAHLTVVLIGERPGLSSPDSLGAYLTWQPRLGRTDAERNCISNIRPEGLTYDLAAAKLHFLMSEARRRRLTGVALKDESGALGR
jgi:ethanolamine ammonia-lyase small subunit